MGLPPKEHTFMLQSQEVKTFPPLYCISCGSRPGLEGAPGETWEDVLAVVAIDKLKEGHVEIRKYRPKTFQVQRPIS